MFAVQFTKYCPLITFIPQSQLYTNYSSLRQPAYITWLFWVVYEVVNGTASSLRAGSSRARRVSERFEEPLRSLPLTMVLRLSLNCFSFSYKAGKTNGGRCFIFNLFNAVMYLEVFFRSRSYVCYIYVGDALAMKGERSTQMIWNASKELLVTVNSDNRCTNCVFVYLRWKRKLLSSGYYSYSSFIAMKPFHSV